MPEIVRSTAFLSFFCADAGPAKVRRPRRAMAVRATRRFSITFIMTWMSRLRQYGDVCARAVRHLHPQARALEQSGKRILSVRTRPARSGVAEVSTASRAAMLGL